MSMKTKEEYMRLALELAARGRGYTSPNPMVGCVVVRDGKVISQGYHERYGEYHAERNALLRCPVDPAGSDLYVTLEPCCHYGKTPPCTEIIISSGIRRVFIGAADSNPLVGGKGIRILKEAGIEVETGILEEECRRQNEVFFHYIENKAPFVAMKYAMTLDGKIACVNGSSNWVTGEESRAYVHELRHQYMGIMVGIGTVLADDPLLNCRRDGGRDPLRIVCDSRLNIPLESQLVKTAGDIPLLVAAAAESGFPKEKAEQLRQAGAEVWFSSGSQVNLSELMDFLYEKKVDSILLEGGGTLNASALEAGIVQRVFGFIAPKLVGGAGAKSPVEGVGVLAMADAWQLEKTEIMGFGEDYCITGLIRR